VLDTDFDTAGSAVLADGTFEPDSVAVFEALDSDFHTAVSTLVGGTFEPQPGSVAVF